MNQNNKFLNTYFKIVVLTVLLPLWVLTQSTISINFPENTSKNTSTRCFTHNGIVYISLTDLINALSLPSFVNHETKKLEIKTHEHKIRITADNSYVVIEDNAHNTNVVQLYNKCYLVNNSYFVPAQKFIPLLNKFIPEEIIYDSGKLTITNIKLEKSSEYDITNISYEEKSNGTLVRLFSTKKILDYDSWVRYDPNDVEKKSGWLYLTIANTRVHLENLKKVKPAGNVKQLLIFPSQKSVQLTFKLNRPITATEVIQAEKSNDLLITIHNAEEQKPATISAKGHETQLERERNRWKMDVIVIDPGHGGKDPGAIGVTRTKEKDITLSVALKLGKLIEKNFPDVKVVYTRKKDEFVELYKRGQIANQANGKLFISLHCNSAVRKPHPANGFEVYLLQLGKTEHALRIAERENSVIQFEEGYQNRYQALTEDNFILLTMAQSAYVKYSEMFSDIISKFVSKYLDISNHGVKQAGFYVLVGASMPNVLVEMGYLSNPKDEKFLKSYYGQQKIAEILFLAVKEYKYKYDKSLEVGISNGTRN